MDGMKGDVATMIIKALLSERWRSAVFYKKETEKRG